MTGKFYLVSAAEQATAPPLQTTGPVASLGVSDAQAIETTFWQSAQASGRREEYELYLSKYPKGKGLYSDLAEIRLAALSQGESTGGGLPGTTSPTAAPKPDLAVLRNEEASKATEDALALDGGKWRELQGRLSGLGFATGGVDGNAGDGTHRAIANWQTSRGYKVSGFLNKPQLDALLAEATPTPTAAIAPSQSPYAPSQPLYRSAAPRRHYYAGGNYGSHSGVAPGAGLIMQGLGMGLGHAFGF
jgi:peptidoglycan hydrolase-like protein with peptidoglycan-binding domain